MSAAFTLHDYVLSGNCYKIRLFAALLGMDYDSIAVDFYPGFEHRSETMLALNPAGTLPVMVTAEGEVLTETNAMLVWMALRAGQAASQWFPATDLDLGPRVQQGLAFGAGLTNSIGLARLSSMLDWPTDGERASKTGWGHLRALELHLTDRQLEGGLWWAGAHPTVADIACFPYVALSPDAGLSHDGFPAIRRWLYAVLSLPGFVTMPGIHALHELR